eukprot:Tamp_10294.p1 GENE.Tamp_10294~~Tamp_10294.p1  ORF type:complete len:414 (+),score=31.02 Tamp_10294:201-1442(+)
MITKKARSLSALLTGCIVGATMMFYMGIGVRGKVSAQVDGAPKSSTRSEVLQMAPNGNASDFSPILSPPVSVETDILPNLGSKILTVEVPLVTECFGLGKNYDEFMPQIFAMNPDVLVKSDPDGQRRDIVDLLSSIGVFTNHFVVNFGCWLTGTQQSMWYDVATGLMMERGWAGLGFDAGKHLTLIRQVAVHRARQNVTFIDELLTGETAARRLRAKNVPMELDLLKVDIDSFDCDLARGILLDGFRPKMLHIELSPVWPRGVRVEYKFGPKVKPFLGGCSCEAIAALGQEYGYMIISAYGIDVTMIRIDLWHEHGLAKFFRKRIGCSTSCGTEYCRQGLNMPCAKWSQLYDEGKHEELVRDVAQTIAAGREGCVGGSACLQGRGGHAGNIAFVSSDHVNIKFLVSAGKLTSL